MDAPRTPLSQSDIEFTSPAGGAGAWVGSRRTDHWLGRLSTARAERIETEFPDWQWNVLDAAFEAGITHLHRFVADHGTSNARQRDTIDGFNIGQWGANRRADYRRGRLPAERIDMAMRIEVARRLVYAAATKFEHGAPDRTLASSYAKTFASDTAMQVTVDAIQLLGGAGYTRGFPVERLTRDAKITQIYEGTNQIQRIVIAKQLLSR